MASPRTNPGTGQARYPGTFLLAFREAVAAVSWQIQTWQADSVACKDAAGESLTVGLENLYRRVRRQDRATWPELIAEFLRKVHVSGARDELDRELSEVVDRLLLRVGPPFPLLQGAAKVWSQPLHDTGLVVSLVIDHPETMSYVTEDMITRSGAPGEHWLTHALKNLRERTPSDALEPVHDDSDVRICAQGDAYDSSRALIIGEQLTDVPHGYFLAIPSRDELLVLPVTAKAITTVHLLKLLVIQSHQKAPYPVSEELYWVFQGKWHAFPIEIKGHEVNVRPPPEFVALLETINNEPNK